MQVSKPDISMGM